MSAYFKEYEVLRSPEPEAFLSLMRSKGIRADVSPRAPEHTPDFSLATVAASSGTYFSWLCYGRDVSLDMEAGRESFAISLPSGGRLRSRTGRDERDVDVGQALFGAADAAQRLEVGWDCPRFYVNVDNRAYRRAFEGWSDSARAPSPLPHVIDLNQGLGINLGRFSRFALDELSSCQSSHASALAGQLESLLYLTLCRIGDPDTGPGGSRGPLPRAVRRAIDYIHANASANLTTAEVVAAAEIPGRSLYRQFEHFVGCSPAAYLRSHRLGLARQGLQAASAGRGTVQRIALDLGFHHLGRFSRTYWARYGELPSETLARNCEKA